MSLSPCSYLDGFLEPVLQLAGSAIYTVRELAAKALVPLVPQRHVTQWIEKLVRTLPLERAHCQSFNALHGTLLQIEQLLKRYGCIVFL